ncbi:MAG: ubiquinol-cytochrome c chaperone [Hyphobacterium sp.]|nr:MAG: ubiquinol-cytochrome c chaperone [Hyphobacterium sp.]
MLSFLKPANPTKRHTQALYVRTVEAARRPEFYSEGGVPDTPEGRFEMIALHVILIIRKLNTEGERGRTAGQALFDYFFKDMDAALREMGIGDTGIGKKVRAMAEVFYGRFKSYSDAADSGEVSAISCAMTENLFDGTPSPSCERFATYFLAASGELEKQSLLANDSPDKLAFGHF